MGAAQSRIYIPPPGNTPKSAAKPVPEQLQRKGDAAGLAYVDCGFAIEREAHRTNQSVGEFARTWAKSCLAEELEWKQNYIAILKYRGDPDPRGMAESFARERRAKKIEQYRQNKVFDKQLRETCGPDFRLCQD